MVTSPTSFSTVALGLLLMVGCGGPILTSTPVDLRDAELPDAWGQSHRAGEALDDAWCASFGSDDLAVLLDSMLDQNLELRQAVLRIDRAHALLEGVRAARRPMLDGGLSHERERPLHGGRTTPETELEMTASWELDLWGRLRSTLEAERQSATAVALDRDALLLSLRAETALRAFEIAKTQEEIRLLSEELESAKTFLDLTRVRHTQGMANAIDIVQQEQLVQELEEARQRAMLRETLVHSALASLMGRPAVEVDALRTVALPELAPLHVDALSPTVLLQRPDVRAAYHRAEAARHLLDAALAERLPRVRLEASLLTPARTLDSLFQTLFLTVAGSATSTLADGGRRSAREMAQAIAIEEALLDFTRVLLRALAEVEDALAEGRALEEVRTSILRQLTLAREAAELAEAQYRSGILDFLRVLSALQSVRRLEMAEMENRRAILAQRIRLCRATAGSVHADPSQDTP